MMSEFKSCRKRDRNRIESEKFRQMERLAESLIPFRVLMTDSPEDLQDLKNHLDVLGLHYDNVHTTTAIPGPGWHGQQRIPAVRVSQAAYIIIASSHLISGN